MGLFSTKHERHFNDHSTHINFPDTVRIEEHKAPTDESIRLMEEMHQKALQNIVSHVKVEDNLVNGEIFLIHQPWLGNEFKIICKFKINGTEFTVEKELDRLNCLPREWSELDAYYNAVAQDKGKAIMLHFALKMLVATAYEQITKEPFPKEIMNTNNL